MFDDVAMRLANDAFVKNFFSNPVISKNEIASRINSLYNGGYFDKYNLKLYTFNAEEIPYTTATQQTLLFTKTAFALIRLLLRHFIT